MICSFFPQAPPKDSPKTIPPKKYSRLWPPFSLKENIPKNRPKFTSNGLAGHWWERKRSKRETEKTYKTNSGRLCLPFPPKKRKNQKTKNTPKPPHLIPPTPHFTGASQPRPSEVFAQGAPAARAALRRPRLCHGGLGRQQAGAVPGRRGEVDGWRLVGRNVFFFQNIFFPQIAGSYRGSNFSKGGIVLANWPTSGCCSEWCAGCCPGCCCGCCPGCSGSCAIGRCQGAVQGAVQGCCPGCSGSCLPFGWCQGAVQGAVRGAPDHVCHWAVSGCCPGCCAGVLFRVLRIMFAIARCQGAVQGAIQGAVQGAVQGAPDHVCH